MRDRTSNKSPSRHVSPKREQCARVTEHLLALGCGACCLLLTQICSRIDSVVTWSETVSYPLAEDLNIKVPLFAIFKGVRCNNGLPYVSLS
jgi:hypothetical protein